MCGGLGATPKFEHLNRKTRHGEPVRTYFTRNKKRGEVLGALASEKRYNAVNGCCRGYARGAASTELRLNDSAFLPIVDGNL